MYIPHYRTVVILRHRLILAVTPSTAQALPCVLQPKPPGGRCRCGAGRDWDDPNSVPDGRPSGAGNDHGFRTDEVFVGGFCCFFIDHVRTNRCDGEDSQSVYKGHIVHIYIYIYTYIYIYIT